MSGISCVSCQYFDFIQLRSRFRPSLHVLIATMIYSGPSGLLKKDGVICACKLWDGMASDFKQSDLSQSAFMISEISRYVEVEKILNINVNVYKINDKI